MCHSTVCHIAVCCIGHRSFRVCQPFQLEVTWAVLSNGDIAYLLSTYSKDNIVKSQNSVVVCLTASKLNFTDPFWPNDAAWRSVIWSYVVKVMACSEPSHYLTQWHIVNWTLKNKFSSNFKQNTDIFVKNTHSKMSSLIRPQCVYKVQVEWSTQSACSRSRQWPCLIYYDYTFD